MERREFLKVAGAAAGSCALGQGTLLAGQGATSGGEDQVAGLPRRVLGRTGAKMSIVAFPGLALAQLNQEEATAGVHKAFDQGINHFDVAPAYGDAEIKMGPALEGLDRSKIFLSCKTKMRDKDGARKELERSLTRLKTDHFDLYQMHHIRWTKEVQQALGPGGAMETFLKAKEEGKIRHIGFSAHTTKGALEMMKGFPFDSVMFPLSYVDYLNLDFGKAVVEMAKERGVAVLAMKAIYAGAWPEGATADPQMVVPAPGEGRRDRAGAALRSVAAERRHHGPGFVPRSPGQVHQGREGVSADHGGRGREAARTGGRVRLGLPQGG